MKWFRTLLLAGLTGWLVPYVHAELRFEKTRVEILARPDQEQVEAVFKVENHGTSDARIVAVTSGCQCLSAKAGAERIPPQGTSEITGMFKVRNVPGVTEKAIQVRVWEEGKERNLTLTVAVELKELITIEPRTVAWQAGESSKAKTFVVKMNSDQPIHLQEVEPSRPGFHVKVETIQEGHEYRVHVTPQETGAPILGVFRFKTDCKHPRFASPVAFGHVKKA